MYIDLLSGSYNGIYPPENVLDLNNEHPLNPKHLEHPMHLERMFCHNAYVDVLLRVPFLLLAYHEFEYGPPHNLERFLNQGVLIGLGALDLKNSRIPSDCAPTSAFSQNMPLNP